MTLFCLTSWEPLSPSCAIVRTLGLSTLFVTIMYFFNCELIVTTFWTHSLWVENVFVFLYVGIRHILSQLFLLIILSLGVDGLHVKTYSQSNNLFFRQVQSLNCETYFLHINQHLNTTRSEMLLYINLQNLLNFRQPACLKVTPNLNEATPFYSHMPISSFRHVYFCVPIRKQNSTKPKGKTLFTLVLLKKSLLWNDCVKMGMGDNGELTTATSCAFNT